jgi:DNA polymerase-3 subunit gamma/tau
MASQVFYRKWRPQTLAGIIGQEHVTQTLLNALANERVSHAYLFCGPRGTGKTTTARGLAKAVNCLNNGKGEPCNECAMCRAITDGNALDVIEVDAASNRGIDEMRDLREKINYAPNQARYKVYIIDEVHMLTKEASNAVLKTLEEPPPHIIFILATTEVHKLLPTILSRCQRFDFRRHTVPNIVSVLTEVGKNEGITAEPEALKLIAKAATGSMRDALNLLQQAYTFYGKEISLQQARDLLGISGDRRYRELAKYLVENDVAAGVQVINSANTDGIDLRQFNRELVEYLRMLLLIKTDSNESLELTAEDIAELKDLATRVSLPRILKAIKLFGQLELSIDSYSTLPLELALVDSTMPADEADNSPENRTEPVMKTVKETPKSPPPTSQPVTQPEEIKENRQPSPAATPPATEGPTLSATPPADNNGGKEPTTPVSESDEISPLAAGSDIVQLQQNWRKMINDAPDGMSKTPAAALLRSASPMSLDGDTIVISFEYAYHKEKMDNIDNQRTADKIVSSFLGRSCQVRCVYQHENNHLVKAALDMGAQRVDTEEA